MTGGFNQGRGGMDFGQGYGQGFGRGYGRGFAAAQLDVAPMEQTDDAGPEAVMPPDNQPRGGRFARFARPMLRCLRQRRRDGSCLQRGGNRF